MAISNASICSGIKIKIPKPSSQIGANDVVRNTTCTASKIVLKLVIKKPEVITEPCTSTDMKREFSEIIKSWTKSSDNDGSELITDKPKPRHRLPSIEYISFTNNVRTYRIKQETIPSIPATPAPTSSIETIDTNKFKVVCLPNGKIIKAHRAHPKKEKGAKLSRTLENQWKARYRQIFPNCQRVPSLDFYQEMMERLNCRWGRVLRRKEQRMKEAHARTKIMAKRNGMNPRDFLKASSRYSISSPLSLESSSL